MTQKELAKVNAERGRFSKPRHPVGDWVWFDVVKGPVVVRGYVHNGYLLQLPGSHLAMIGLFHQVKGFTKKRADKWAKAGKRSSILKP